MTGLVEYSAKLDENRQQSYNPEHSEEEDTSLRFQRENTKLRGENVI